MIEVDKIQKLFAICAKVSYAYFEVVTYTDIVPEWIRHDSVMTPTTQSSAVVPRKKGPTVDGETFSRHSLLWLQADVEQLPDHLYVL